MQQDTFQIIIALISIPILLALYWRLRLKRLKVYFSPILGKIEIFEKYNGEKLLTINSYAQGVSTEQESIKQSYWYKIAQVTNTFCQKKKKPQVLMLGLGSATITNLIVKKNPNIFQTIVEIDPLIIQACRDFFNLDQIPHSQVIQADVYQLASQKRAFKQQFDVIIYDVFLGRPPYISLESNQPTFIQKTLPWLKSNGMVIFNRPAHTEQSKAGGYQLKAYLDTLFQRTALFYIKDPRGYKSHIITASFKKSLAKT